LDGASVDAFLTEAIDAIPTVDAMRDIDLSG
jgi:hypothetical protein